MSSVSLLSTLGDNTAALPAFGGQVADCSWRGNVEGGAIPIATEDAAEDAESKDDDGGGGGGDNDDGGGGGGGGDSEPKATMAAAFEWADMAHEAGDAFFEKQALPWVADASALLSMRFRKEPNPW